LLNIQDNLSERPIIVDYQGIFSQEVIMELGEVLSKEISSLESEPFCKRVFSIFIEMAQNVQYHSSRKSVSASGLGMVRIFRDHTGYYLETSNPVNESAQSELRQRVQEINQLNPLQLKEKCIQTRRFEKAVSGKGAGLGLIEIARWSGQPLSILFQKNQEGYLNFIFRVSVKP